MDGWWRLWCGVYIYLVVLMTMPAFEFAPELTTDSMRPVSNPQPSFQHKNQRPRWTGNQLEDIGLKLKSRRASSLATCLHYQLPRHVNQLP